MLKPMRIVLIMQYAIFLLMIFISTSPVWARNGISVASGYGVAQSTPFRLGFQQEFNKQWRKESNWPITAYWEGSFYDIQTHNKNLNPASHKHLNAVALAAVARFEHKEKIQFGWPYLEIGFGASSVSHKEFGGRKLSTYFQFEDRVGIGVRFGEDREYDLSYRAIHFSNAYIGTYNHGINLHVLMLGYWFN